jgi:RNA polymerase sigma-70 factor (ECF subfamily)
MNDIVINIKNGHIESFQVVYNQYHSKLYFYVLKHTQSPYLSEETVQLTFIKLWEKRSGLSEDIDISAQIFRIAKSMMYDLMRKESRSRESIAELAKNTEYLQIDPDILQKESLRQVYDTIERMSPVRKMVFKLSRFNGLPHKKIAEKLSISPKTVENHIGRALRQLKDAMLLIIFLLPSSLH